MADRAKRLRGGGLGELYQSGVLTAVGTPAAASASALAVLLARAGAWHRPRALTGHAALALGSTLVLGATLAMQGESATLAALVSALPCLTSQGEGVARSREGVARRRTA